MSDPRTVAVKVCGAYLGDNDGTCPQLTCIRPIGHIGAHDNASAAEDVGVPGASWNEAGDNGVSYAG